MSTVLIVGARRGTLDQACGSLKTRPPTGTDCEVEGLTQIRASTGFNKTLSSWQGWPRNGQVVASREIVEGRPPFALGGT
jgi:hypothetical protein